MASRFTDVALASRAVELTADRLFDLRAVAAMGPSLQAMAGPWLQVHAVARERGLRLMTSDRKSVV